MSVLRLALSAISAFAVVLVLGVVLHAFHQNSKQWWLLLLPVWAFGTYMAYRFGPRRKRDPEPEPYDPKQSLSAFDPFESTRGEPPEPPPSGVLEPSPPLGKRRRRGRK